MAYIYYKNTGACWIIGPQESIIYPFSLGSYQEIRMGGFFSVISGNSFNSEQTVETVNTNSSQYTFYVGLKDSSPIVPGSIGSTYFGLTVRVGDTNCNISSNVLGFGSDTNDGWGDFITSDATGNIIYFSQNEQNGIYLTNPAPDTNFASFWGISFGLQGNVFSGQVIYDTNFYTDITTGNLDYLINNPPHLSSFITGFYTTGNQNTNELLQQADAIYINFPFYNNQLRIHSLAIELFS